MEYDIEECAICLEDISNSGTTTLNCGHVIHTQCLMLHVNYKITKNINDIDSFTYDDIHLHNYVSHGRIKAQMAV